MLLVRKSQRMNRAVHDEMWNPTKGDAEESRGKKGLRRPVRANPAKGTPSSKHVPCRSHRDASDAVLPQAVATVRPVPLNTPNILLVFHRRLCLSPPSSSFNPTLLHPFALFFPSSCPQRRVLFPFPLFRRFWPSHASSVTTLSLPSVSHPPYKCFTLSYPFPNSTVAVPPPLYLLIILHGFISSRSRVFK